MFALKLVLTKQSKQTETLKFGSSFSSFSSKISSFLVSVYVQVLDIIWLLIYTVFWGQTSFYKILNGLCWMFSSKIIYF